MPACDKEFVYELILGRRRDRSPRLRRASGREDLLRDRNPTGPSEQRLGGRGRYGHPCHRPDNGSP
ncbi:MAG: hypothetical protein MZV70_34795 [Desulfobacterales bacterium]|nr:hypothetical protein [Desulfobacterales bacterium]